MIVAPHARLAAGNLAPRGNRVPAVGPVIDAVQQDPLVMRIGGEIRLLEQPPQHRQSSLRVGVSVVAERMPQTEEPLRGNRARRGIHRLVVVEGICRLRSASRRDAANPVRPCPSSRCRPARSPGACRNRTWRGPPAPASRTRHPFPERRRRQIPRPRATARTQAARQNPAWPTPNPRVHVVNGE